MSEEVQSAIQVIELFGRMMKGAKDIGVAGIKLGAFGISGMVKLSKLKDMQDRLKLHYASVGTHNTMRLDSLEEMTGGQYKILNIPLEQESELIGFYDILKKMKVAFAELPDLAFGDGYTQIAFNPQDEDKVRFSTEAYKKVLAGRKPENMGLDEYLQTGGEKGREILNDLARKGYEMEVVEEQLNRVREHIDQGEGISVNVSALLVDESMEDYLIKLPGERFRRGGDERYIKIPKSNSLLLDDEQTIVSYLAPDTEVDLYIRNKDSTLTRKETLTGGEVRELFAEIPRGRQKAVAQLKSTQTDIFPSFSEGRTIIETPPARPMTQAEKEMGKILSLDAIRERMMNEEYVMLGAEMDRIFVAEDCEKYMVPLPMETRDDEVLRYVEVEPTDAFFSPDGGRMLAYIKKSEKSPVIEFDGKGNRVRERLSSNMDIVKAYREHSKSIPRIVDKSHKVDEAVRKAEKTIMKRMT